MSNLEELQEFGKNLGAEASIVPNRAGQGYYEVLFICTEEIANDFDDDIRTWKNIITIQEGKKGYEVSSRNGGSISDVELGQLKRLIKYWLIHPDIELSKKQWS